MLDIKSITNYHRNGLRRGRGMNLQVEKEFAVKVIYNGMEKSIRVESEEHITTLLKAAITAFGVTQNPHLLSLFREDGSVVDESQSVEQARLKPGELL